MNVWDINDDVDHKSLINWCTLDRERWQTISSCFDLTLKESQLLFGLGKCSVCVVFRCAIAP